MGDLKMKLLDFIKSLFKKEQKKLSPKEMVTFYGIPEELNLSKKNLIICDMVDVAFSLNGNIVSTAMSSLPNHKNSGSKTTLNLMHLSDKVPVSNALKLHISGIVFDPDTHAIEYTFSSEVDDVTVLDDKVTFNMDKMETTVISKEMV